MYSCLAFFLGRTSAGCMHCWNYIICCTSARCRRRRRCRVILHRAAPRSNTVQCCHHRCCNNPLHLSASVCAIWHLYGCWLCVLFYWYSQPCGVYGWSTVSTNILTLANIGIHLLLLRLRLLFLHVNICRSIAHRSTTKLPAPLAPTVAEYKRAREKKRARVYHATPYLLAVKSRALY